MIESGSLTADWSQRIRIWVGVDQTGATTKPGGLPRPLKTAILELDRNGRPCRLRFGELSKLNEQSLLGVNAIIEKKRTAIVTDCVFGLPDDLKLPLGFKRRDPWGWFSRAAAHPGWGLKAGEKFFKRLCPSDSFPKRKAEIIAKANSVFKSRPFQKNIQTGTYRIWKDLGSENKWASVWPIQEPTYRPVLLEGYPSLLWRQEFGFKSRQPLHLNRRLKEILGPKVKIELGRTLGSDSDLCDAAVLAVGGWLLSTKGYYSAFKPIFRSQEGWIVGLEKP